MNKYKIPTKRKDSRERLDLEDEKMRRYAGILMALFLIVSIIGFIDGIITKDVLEILISPVVFGISIWGIWVSCIE